MTLITFQDGKPLLKDDGAIGAEQACCCEKCEGPCDEENPCPEGCECCDGECQAEPCPCDPCCPFVDWEYTLGACNDIPPQRYTNSIDADCYSYFVWEDWDCVGGVGRDCGGDGQCNIYARVKVTCASTDPIRGCGTDCTVGEIEYENTTTGEWGNDPLVMCGCPDSFGSLAATVSTCAEFCPEGVYVNGPTITWVWSAGLGGWLPAPPETIESASQKCQDFYDANGLIGGGASPPPFAGAFDGEQVTVPSCICGS